VSTGVGWETAVATSSRSAAFFDLDRTLISGSSAFSFGIAAWRADLMPTRRLLRDAVAALSFRFTGSTDEKAAEVRARILDAVRGNRQSDLVALNADIIPKLMLKVRPEARELLDLHRRAGRNTYIVSASPQEMVGPLAEALGMTGGVGTVSEVKEGVYTGELAGPFCYSDGKVEAIRELAGWEGFDLERCFAYSDSASDLPMLEAVGHPVAVNPDGPLERVAHQRGWPIVIFSRRTKRVVKRTAALTAAAGFAAGSFAAGLAIGRRHPI
jgi:HAD superfamily hydrolase (TIGR01490 family)